MSEIIQVQDEYYIRASSSLADDRTRVLKHGETFAVFDRYGDIRPLGLREQGIYHEGTRYLSLLTLHLGSERPLLLSSTVKEDNALLAVDLTNPDISHDHQVVVPRGAVHIFRSKFLWQGACYERIRVTNYSLAHVRLPMTLRFDADFADIFEVRGMERRSHGHRREPALDEGKIALSYLGLDDVTRTSYITFDPVPASRSAEHIEYRLDLAPRDVVTVFLTVSCNVGERCRITVDYATGAALSDDAFRSAREHDSVIHTSNGQFNDWINRSLVDLHMMTTNTPDGPYPYAGVPWFSTVFGRDGIITALETLWVNPGIARGVLAHLAATQAREDDAERDARPGKILHETRKGEMAALGEVPFGRYYGSVDSTPLFVMLAWEYAERSGDIAFVESLWPNVERALEWIDRYGDTDGDGMVDYQRRSPKGLVQQGWKDSNDSVFHADGELADGPIALCEVQGYVYAAYRAAAQLATMLGRPHLVDGYMTKATAMKERFETRFWCEEIASYALALDGAGRPCRVRTSNPGHCLFAGVASAERAALVAQSLMSEDMYSGWGVRTCSCVEKRYDPMSYHNGSVWPHDNALIAAGFSRYGLQHHAARIMNGLFEAAGFMDLHRLPELFCGFDRRPGEGPTMYPVACSPQAWAAGAVYMLLQASLGLHIDARRREVRFSNPSLPRFLRWIRISNLRVDGQSVDLFLERYRGDVGINVIRREGGVRVVAVK
ncbi:MAG TPA: amylo-alpha-1,6-glucosidase [Candidatus Limnocylindrales bacterium]|nr:amylo-alpha-1,6-glucosidase [Candidatus Limnocylindrales bacterium]